MLLRAAKPSEPADSAQSPVRGGDGLVDELREMFHTQVHAAPVPHDPARVALSRAGRVGQRRRVVAVAATIAGFAAVLGGAATMHVQLPGNGSYTVTYANLFGGGGATPDRAPGNLPVLARQLDIWAGNQLWTTDGRRLQLTGVDSADKVIRVAAGWLYSEHGQLWLLPADSGDGASVVDGDVSAWAVSLDGRRLAVVTGDTTLRVEPIGQGPGVSTAVPSGVTPVFIDGSNVVLSRAGGGFDHWSGEKAGSYRETWNDNLLAVLGSPGSAPLAIQQVDGAACLQQLTAAAGGLTTGATLGCGELAAAAVSGSRSPGGRWLAIPATTGVDLVDLGVGAELAGEQSLELRPVASCVAAEDSPLIWADSETLLTRGLDGNLVTCTPTGERRAVTLPAGVDMSWRLVPSYGVSG